MGILLDGPIYKTFLSGKDYSIETKQCIASTAGRLLETTTTVDRPGMLLGKVQSGKTRTFLGILALAFDNGFDSAVVLTKGTIALTEQTLERLHREFRALVEADQVQIFDVMHLPSNLTRYELSQKLIIVCKKEDDNIRRLDEALFNQYPQLGKARCLIIDDEADFASIGFRRTKDEGVKINKIAGQIDDLRRRLSRASFLQVTATPYSLYLQPDGSDAGGVGPAFMPTRPAFTELVPVHPQYIGGEYYFEQSLEENSLASHLHCEVPLSELRILRKQDGRSFKISEALASKAVDALRFALITFVVGGCMRRVQDEKNGKFPKKFSFIVHTERSREAHSWQEQIVHAIVQQLQEARTLNETLLRDLVRRSYDDLAKSVRLVDCYLPSYEETIASVSSHLETIMITKVNSENDIKQLLDESGQLRLRTPLNIFIGGQILDRGLTIANLIGFYYGRTTNRFQQDTVLQHSRMYGTRPIEDLSVTRFHTASGIYNVMETIHEFDEALRKAFEAGGHESGVVFLRKDDANRIVPCSPNKILLSSTTTLRPGKRLLPIGFQTIQKTEVASRLAKIERILGDYKNDIEAGRAFLLEVDVAKAIIDLVAETLEFEDEGSGWDVSAFKSAMDYLSKSISVQERKGKLWCIVKRDRNINRMRPGGRVQNAPDTKQEQAMASSLDDETPVLMLLSQEGKEKQGWRDCPFWWPVLQVPRKTKTTIFASEMVDTE